VLVVGQQKIEVVSLGAVVLLIALATAAALAWPALNPWAFLIPTGAALALFWAARWEITALAWLWIYSHGILDWPDWKIDLAGFFNLTVPRLIFLAALPIFGLHFLSRRGRIRLDRGILWAMLALLFYCGVSASFAGWRAATYDVATAPYYRFLGSMLFPFLMFFLVYNTIRDERQIYWALGAMVVYGWYALYISYLQYAANLGWASAREFIWPKYINDSTWGIHFDRSRGAFAGSPPQAFLLVCLFYVDLFLIQKLKEHSIYRTVLALQAILTPPAIFFTGLRSGYLAFLLCGIIWCATALRHRLGLAKMTLAGLALFVIAAVSWERLTGGDRMKGGLAQKSPIVSRLILLEQTWEIVRQKPLFGVGFGHFVDAQQQLERDPGSLAGMSYGALVEHNLFLNMLAETGAVGLALTVLILILLVRQSIRLFVKLPPDVPGPLSRMFVILFWVLLANFVTDAMFRDPLWDVFTNALFWSLAALIVGFNRLLEPVSIDESVVGY